MNSINEVGNYFTSSAFLSSVVVICITVILLAVIKKYLIKKVAYTTKNEQHQNTFIGVIFSLLQYVVILACIAIVLNLHGVNVTSIVAGFGIMATLIGLALQDTMKDIISGINIYNNNFYKVGDLVRYNGEICDVKYFNARVTKFVSIYTHSTYTVCNSMINSIEKIKNITFVSLLFDYEEDKKKVLKSFEQACEEIKKDKDVEDSLNLGIVDITNDGVSYAAIIFTPGHKAMFVRMKFIDLLYDYCKKNKVSPNFNDERKLKYVK